MSRAQFPVPFLPSNTAPSTYIALCGYPPTVVFYYSMELHFRTMADCLNRWMVTHRLRHASR